MSSAAPLDPHWRLRYILLAPHRLGFSLAAAVLIAASLWWALVQVDRATGAFGLPTDGTPPLITHAALMSCIAIFANLRAGRPAAEGTAAPGIEIILRENLP